MNTAAGVGPADLEEELPFEVLLLELSTTFINLRPAEVDLRIEDALRRVCEHLGVDVAVLWQWSADAPGVLLPTHVHPAPQAGPPFDPMRQESYPWVVQQILAGRMVVVSRLDDIPAEAGTDRENARRSGIKSNLTLPLSAGATPPIGALAFNVLREERDWPAALVRRLQLVAQIFTNTLARKRADEARWESEEINRATFDQAAVGIAHVSIDGSWLRVNDKLCAIVGYSREELVGGMTFQGITHPEDLDADLDHVRQVLDGRVATYSMEKRYRRKDRSIIWVNLTVSLVRSADGRPRHFISIIEDITERKRAEQALKHSLEEIERLTDRLRAESDYLKAEIKEVQAQNAITGKSAAIQKVLHQVEQVAPTNSAVIIFGETGTGKELLAEAIHRLSPRARNVMVKVNCAALPSGLVESELFGREKGAFTGALARQVGRFEVADGSTLFLDEVGELPADVQVKLLRVLQEGEFERLGSPRTIKVNVRVIAATNRDLADEVRKGRFREDLYYRLNVFPIRMPPLRERPQDIPLLVWDFLADFSTRMGKKITQVPRPTMDALQRYAWPGNVRELRNVIEHGAIITRGETLRIPLLDDSPPGAAPPQTMADAEREHVLKVLERTRWRIKGPTGAAAALGLKPSTLYGRMKKLGIPLRRESENTNS
jgi:PAS domain S-box-containing protein